MSIISLFIIVVWSVSAIFVYLFWMLKMRKFRTLRSEYKTYGPLYESATRKNDLQGVPKSMLC